MFGAGIRLGQHFRWVLFRTAYELTTIISTLCPRAKECTSDTVYPGHFPRPFPRPTHPVSMQQMPRVHNCL